MWVTIFFFEFSCVFGLAGSGVANEKKDKGPEFVEAPIVYEDLMLIVADNKGNVAAMIFPKEIARGIHYKFRFLAHGSKKEVQGTGLVSQEWKEINVEGETKFVLDMNAMVIRTGAIELKWAYRIPASGWIYYQPEILSVQIGGPSERFKDVDLRRFAKKPGR